MGVHRIVFEIRRHDKVAIRCIGFTGTMPEWYVKKNHRAWYEEMVGREISESQEPKEPKIETKEEEIEEPPEKKVTEEKPTAPSPTPSESA